MYRKQSSDTFFAVCIQLPSYIDNGGAVSQSVRETRAGLGLELGPTLLVCDIDFCRSFILS